MTIHRSDTIIALSTPQGIGAIGVIRLSGPEAIQVVDKHFFGANLEKAASHTVHYGKIRNETDDILDECLVTIFRAPRSYTTEDVIEISCHGSPYIIQEVIQLFLRQGIRHAEPGEFTMRSFLNGQLDLVQAEAVADLIESESKASHDVAIRQMRGGFSKTIKGLRDKLIEFASLIELELDFSEEDVEFADRRLLVRLVTETQAVVRGLIRSFELGNVLKKGIPTVIAGRPNAGKSTLLNALLEEERAIVSDIPGTTRDTVEEHLNINGVLFKFIDTAGLRAAEDAIEKIGVSRTMEKIGASTLVIYVVDVTETSPYDVWSDIKVIDIRHPRLIVLLNKMDLAPHTKPETYYYEEVIHAGNTITASAKNRMNIEYLKEKILDSVLADQSTQDASMVTNARHYDALVKAEECLDRVLHGIDTGITGDFVAQDIRHALHYLGEITGEIHTDDLLESIFSRFCIGK